MIRELPIKEVPRVIYRFLMKQKCLPGVDVFIYVNKYNINEYGWFVMMRENV